MKWAIISDGKSGKREIAALLVMFWVLITCYLFFFIDHTIFGEYREGWGTLTIATFTFAGGAFGIDAAIKSGWIGNRSPSPAPRPSQRKRPGADTEEIE